MTSTSLNCLVTLGAIALAAACGSSDKGVGTDGQNNIGGRSSYFGGSSSDVGVGGLNNAGAPASGGGEGGEPNNLGGSTDNTSNAGNPNSAGDTSGAGDSTSVAGAGNGGTTGMGDTSHFGTTTGSTRDIVDTGGTGNSRDIGTGGGTSRDVGTGGGFSIDQPTGGGNSVDIPTGGGNSVDIPTGGGNSIDQPTGGGSSIDLGTGGAPSIDLGCEKTALTDINVYVTMDATPTGADTEGNMYIGGDLVASGYSVGAKDALDCSRYSLVVGGDVAIKGGTINGGMAVYGGNSNTSTGVTVACGSTIQRGRPVDFDALKGTVEELSRRLANLTPNCTVSTVSGKLVLTGTDKKLNICNIDAAQLTGNVDVNFPAGSSVVVNVTGTDVSWGNGAVCLNKQCDDSDQATNVLWNFPEATSLYSSGMAIEGSVLAPFATLDGGGGHIAGQVIVQYLTGGLEYHPYYFDGCIVWPTL